MPSAITVYIIHHPQSDQTRDVCRRLQQWFRLSDSSGAQSDAGLPVWYRRQIAPLTKQHQLQNRNESGSYKPRFRFDPEIHWDAALLNVVILLVDQYFVASADWCQATEHLLAKLNDPDRPPLILPVALHDSFYRLSQLYNNCNPIRLLDQPNPAAATVTLRRLVSEAVSRRLRQTSADQNLPKLNVFLSHAKADGREIAERIRDSVSRFSQMDAWYDANELAIGGKWQEKIIDAAATDTAAMISVVTDKYSSRPWCRLEVEAARTPQPLDQSSLQIWKLQPAIAVHEPRSDWSRTMQAVAGMPRIGWQSQQTDSCVAEIIDRLMLETLLSGAHRQVARELQSLELNRDAEIALSTLYITWTPCQYTLAALRNALAENKSAPRPGKITRIVYPGYDLRAAEISELQTTLRTFSPRTQLVSFEEAFLPLDRELDRPAGTLPRLAAARPKIALSGIGDDTELQPCGMGCEHLEELLARLTVALLKNNCQLILGGSLARLDRTATTSLIELAQTWIPEKTLQHVSLGYPDTWPFQNFLQWPDCEQLTPEHHAQLAGICQNRAVRPKEPPVAASIRQLDATTSLRYGADSTRLLRKQTTELAHMRVIFGGLLKATRGWMPAALEEAGLSIAASQPLILLGGFGGAAADIAKFLLTPGARLPESLHFAPDWILRKCPDLPDSRMQTIEAFHQKTLRHLRNYRKRLHAVKNMSEKIHGIPCGILLDCLEVTNMRRAVRLVTDALRCLPESAQAAQPVRTQSSISR